MFICSILDFDLQPQADQSNVAAWRADGVRGSWKISGREAVC
ncbi:hypothetical protein I553_10595 [Mycobacterium xenopi 4042]|uniref:Uncharacterized protein n=1 Tax=Mycobacterium xenopi 4042 TaxID=1299334 RepID=X7ZDA3_MYCXE|nr:hypothetical protein I553_10595 [Mycobacterium xenopi 4042]